MRTRIRRPFRLLMVVLVLIGAGMLVRGLFFAPSTRMTDAFERDGVRLVAGGLEVADGPAPLLRDGHVLLAFDTVKARFDPYIWWDDALSRVTVTTRDKVIRMQTESLEARVNDEPLTLSFPASEIDGTVYLPIDFLSSLYGLKVTWVESTQAVVVDRSSESHPTCVPAVKKLTVRKAAGWRSPVVEWVQRDVETPAGAEAAAARMTVFGDDGEWLLVRCADGVVGYVPAKEVATADPADAGAAAGLPGGDGASAQTEASGNASTSAGRIVLGWEMQYETTSKYLSRDASENPDILSPTWFSLIDAEGSVLSRADPAYVAWAHEAGRKVWALFANDFDDIDATSAMLNDGEKRESVIRQLLADASLSGVDGINIDFENVLLADREALTQFVRELAPPLREQGLSVTMDVSVPGGSENWSQCFDRKALAEAVDYLCLMAYDQHWQTSPTAGSTAELGWVEEKLLATLEEVPADRLILGIPLYSRLWQTTGNGAGSTVKAVKSLGTDACWKYAGLNAAEVTWDAAAGQYHATWNADGSRFDVWMEDRNAVDLKSALVLKYGLAGAGAWAVNHAGYGIWDLLDENLTQTGTYAEWQQAGGGTPRYESTAEHSTVK